MGGGRTCDNCSKVRAALDAEDKPLPRIERVRDNILLVLPGYTPSELRLGPGPSFSSDIEPAPDILKLTERAYGALSKLAGHDLPVWEPKTGAWEELGALPAFIPVNNLHPKQNISAIEDVLRQNLKPLPFKAWRYTRSAE